MKRTFYSWLLALFLAAIGLSIFIHKLTALEIPALPNQLFRTWYVEAKVLLEPPNSPILNNEGNLPQKIEFYLPQNSERYGIVEETFINEGFERRIEQVKDSSNRVAIFTREGSVEGGNVLFYRGIIRRRSDVNPQGEIVPVSGRQLVSKQIGGLDDKLDQVKDNLEENYPQVEIDSLLSEAKEKSNDVFSFTKKIYELTLNEDDIRVQAIKRNIVDKNSSVKLAAFLLSKADVSVRVGNGIFLRSDEVYSSDFIEWLEVEEGDRWLAFDPIDSSFKEQDRYLVWWYGDNEVLQGVDLGSVNLEVVVQPNTDQGLTRSIWQGMNVANPFLQYSFLNLPLTTQRVFQVLVLVPIGALIISILHQMIGLKTFGTFTPILISLAFRQTGLLAGIGFFVFIVILGLLFRSYLNRLQLLIVPRLASILTATVLIVGLIAIVMENFDFNVGVSVSLFPIVILAMTIERASMMWEENGAKDTLIAGLGTVVAALIGYLCMINDYVQYWFFMFPELLLIVLGINVMVGRYNGYKLIEYFRFYSLQRS